MNKSVIKGIVIVVVLALLILLVVKLSKKKEGYAEVMIADTYNPFMYSDPGFRPELPPRFDPYRMSGGHIKSSFPGFNKQGAGITPLSHNERCDQNNKEGFDELIIQNSREIDGGCGNETGDCKNGPSDADRAGDFSSLGLMNNDISKYKKGCDSIKEDAVLKFKSAQGYADPEQLLPVPDIKNCLVDPSDPENYMYDRTIFAPLKRRHGQVAVDFVRGDLYIPAINSGWFFAPTLPGVDLQRGSINILNSSIDDQDVIYSNSRPIVAPTEQEQEKIWDDDPVNKLSNPWGNQILHRE